MLVQCPACEQSNQADEAYCGQCGTELTHFDDAADPPIEEAATSDGSPAGDDALEELDIGLKGTRLPEDAADVRYACPHQGDSSDLDPEMDDWDPDLIEDLGLVPAAAALGELEAPSADEPPLEEAESTDPVTGMAEQEGHGFEAPEATIPGFEDLAPSPILGAFPDDPDSDLEGEPETASGAMAMALARAVARRAEVPFASPEPGVEETAGGQPPQSELAPPSENGPSDAMTAEIGEDRGGAAAAAIPEGRGSAIAAEIDESSSDRGMLDWGWERLDGEPEQSDWRCRLAADPEGIATLTAPLPETQPEPPPQPAPKPSAKTSSAERWLGLGAVGWGAVALTCATFVAGYMMNREVMSDPDQRYLTRVVVPPDPPGAADAPVQSAAHPTTEPRIKLTPETEEALARLSRPLARRDEVARVQDLLRALGYDPGPTDGLRGEKTRKAAVAFQTDAGLLTSGRLNVALLEQLEAAYQTIPTSGLGVTRSKIEAAFGNFESPESGFAFMQAKPLDGQPRVLGQAHRGGATLELVGPEDNLVRAAILFGLDARDPDMRARRAAYTAGFLRQVVPDWPGALDWTAAHLDRSAELGEARRSYGAKEVAIVTFKEIGLVSISVSGPKEFAREETGAYARGAPEE